MLLAVTQPEFHSPSVDASPFTAAVERGVGREEFDVLVLPTPATSLFHAVWHETGTSVQIVS
jgi:hypothetical protein